MPAWRSLSGSVRLTRMHQSAMCANDDQTFWPLTTQWSPSSSARVRAAGEVGAGAGLGEALAPDLLGREDLREVALLLLVGAVRDDRRPGHAEADHADVRRRLGARHLLEEDRLVACAARRRRRTPSGQVRPA